jgi:transcription termination/antitermination protein NusG
MAHMARSSSTHWFGFVGYGCYGHHPRFDRWRRSRSLEFVAGLVIKEFEVVMSLQEPQEEFERDIADTDGDETAIESPLSDSDSVAQLNESESVDVPTDEMDTESPDKPVEDVVVRAPAKKRSASPPPTSEESLPTDIPEGPAWYVIHCYSGYENKVRHNLEQRIETMGMKDRIFDVVIPTQEEIEVKDGKRRTVERHIFPGYVLVNMALTEESWYVVRNTPGVTGFVGMGNNPTALRPEEVSQIIKRMEAEAPTVKVTYKVGERVRIIDGPFNDFRGVVSEIDMERTKVRVMVSFFGRETPVELDFLQVEKA